jgi:anti-sigma B factor antagonist
MRLGSTDQPAQRPDVVTDVGSEPGQAACAGGLQLAVTVAHDQARVTVRGEVDLATAPGLGACFQSLARRGPITVVADLHEVTFLDAAGLRVFVTAHNQLCREGGNLLVTSPSQRVRRVLELTGLDAVFGVQRPSDEAKGG